jgi:hypothetical protein
METPLLGGTLQAGRRELLVPERAQRMIACHLAQSEVPVVKDAQRLLLGVRRRRTSA